MRLLRNKKGLSTVMSAVLMILIVVSGMSLLFAFFVNYAGDFQRGSGSAVLESLVVENVWFKNDTYVEVWVYNIGKIPFDITQVYFDDILVPISNVSTVDVGGHWKLSLTSSIPFENGMHLYKLVTARGVSFEGVCKR